MKCYYGYSKDAQVLENSASGGTGYLIAKMFFEKGFSVYGVRYSDDFSFAYYDKAKTINDLLLFCGVKYIFGKENGVKNKILSDLENGKNVAVFGLPCFINALSKKVDNVAKEKRKNLVCVDLVCHGPMNLLAHQKFIQELNEKYNSNLTSFLVRSKRRGWTKPVLFAKFENGSEHTENFYESDYCYAFGVSTNEGCFTCENKGANRKSDITIGDYWGANSKMLGYNEMGTSLIIVNTALGEKIYNDLEETMILYEADEGIVKKNNPYYYNSVSRHQNREKFLKNIKKTDFHTAVFRSYSLKAKIHYILNKISNKIRRQK